MTKKQKKIALTIELIYVTIWLAVIIATGTIGSVGIGLVKKSRNPRDFSHGI
jgi:hypothetical protein